MPLWSAWRIFSLRYAIITATDYQGDVLMAIVTDSGVSVHTNRKQTATTDCLTPRFHGAIDGGPRPWRPAPGRVAKAAPGVIAPARLKFLAIVDLVC